MKIKKLIEMNECEYLSEKGKDALIRLLSQRNPLDELSDGDWEVFTMMY